MSMQINGMDELMRRLQRVGDAMGDDIKDKALKESAVIMRDKAKENVNVRTGTLRDSIDISDVKDETIHIGPTNKGFYGLFVELGTKKMNAKPFLGPTYENNKSTVQSKISEVIRRELGL